MRHLTYTVAVIGQTLIAGYFAKECFAAGLPLFCVLPLVIFFAGILVTLGFYETEGRNRSHELRLEHAKMESEGVSVPDEKE